MGGALSSDPECQANASVSACKVGRELMFGSEFVTKGSGDSIIVIPLMPLQASQGYLLAVTKVVKDTNNASIAPSSTYESVRLDVATQPLPLPSQLGLQVLINSYEDKLEEGGVDVEEVIYSAVFTTQSTADVFNATKLMMLSGNPYFPTTLAPLVDTTYTAGDMLVGAGVLNPAESATDAAIYAGASRASMYVSTLTAPYFLDSVTAENCTKEMVDDSYSADSCPSLFGRFSALGDSPVTVLGAVASGAFPQAAMIAQYDMQKAAFGRGDFTGDAAQLVGMQFNVGSAESPVYIDGARHLTKFNPIPMPKSISQLDVLVSMPNVDVINAARSEENMMEMPATGWPVMIYAHGITTKKETMLAFVGAMSEAGVAVIAIDQPLHGSRAGEALVGGEIDSVNSEDDPTAYLNLVSLLTGRDNVRQSAIDGLALRLALNTSPDAMSMIDPTKVSFYGHSLGGITGSITVASANTPISPNGNPFAIDAAAFLAPGGGIPGLLLESVLFSPDVKAGLTGTATFQGILESAALANGLTLEQLAALAEAGAPEYQGLVDAVYAPFSAEFNFAAQTIMDAGDPVNYASTLGGNTNAIHIMEVVGNDTNLPDLVVPNNTVNSPLAGTDPLIALAGLTQVDMTTVVGEEQDGVKTVVRFTDGHHSSLLTTDLSAPTNTAAGNLLVLTEMQTQLATFIASRGQALVVTDTSVIQAP